MAITLDTLAIGDTNYISKHNNNNTAIKTAIDALQDAQTQGSVAVVNFPAFALALLGTAAGRFTETDVTATDGGSATLDIAAGTVWVPGATQVRTGAATSLDFTGQTTGTYYTHMDFVGAWTFDQVSTDAIHVINFTAPSTFSSITQPTVVWGDAIHQAAKTSTVLGAAVYEELDQRFEAGEAANASRHPVTITASDVTLTTAEGLEHGWFDLSGTLTGNRNLIVPDFEKIYIIRNNTSGAFDVTVKTSAQLGGVVVEQGSTALLLCDGTNVLTFPISGQATGASAPFIVGSWKNGSPTASERVLGFTFPSGVTGIDLPAGATNSSVEAETAATAQTDFDLQKNGSSIGTIRFAASGTVATFVSVSNTTFTGGDTMEIIAPGTADSTLAECYFTIYMTRDA